MSFDPDQPNPLFSTMLRDAERMRWEDGLVTEAAWMHQVLRAWVDRTHRDSVRVRDMAAALKELGAVVEKRYYRGRWRNVYVGVALNDNRRPDSPPSGCLQPSKRPVAKTDSLTRTTKYGNVIVLARGGGVDF